MYFRGPHLKTCVCTYVHTNTHRLQLGQTLRSLCLVSGMLLLLLSGPVMPNSLQPHGLQHATPPCPSPSPEVCQNSFLLHQ